MRTVGSAQPVVGRCRRRCATSAALVGNSWSTFN